MSACITPNHQHTTRKINESTLLFKSFFKHLKTEKPSTKSYVSTWKYFDSLEFLKDSLVARPIKNNLDDDDSPFSNPSIYNSYNPPSAKSVRKMVKGQKSNVE